MEGCSFHLASKLLREHLSINISRHGEGSEQGGCSISLSRTHTCSQSYKRATCSRTKNPSRNLLKWQQHQAANTSQQSSNILLFTLWEARANTSHRAADWCNRSCAWWRGPGESRVTLLVPGARGLQLYRVCACFEFRSLLLITAGKTKWCRGASFTRRLLGCGDALWR